MSYTLPDAVLYGQSMALGAGATALIAGQLGPQVATPEEIFTVPGAMITGFGAGMGARFAEQSARIEAGLQYTEMINEGIDPQVAKYVSSGVGLVNGTLEVIGAGAIAAPFKRLLSKRVTQEVAAAMTKPTVAMAVKEFGKSYATAIGAEVGTEILQEIAGIAGDEIGRAYSKPELESKLTTEEGRAEIAQRIVSVMEEVTKGMAVLALPGAGLSFRSDYRRAQDAKKQTQFFVELTRAATESEVRKRNPDAYQTFIAQQSDGTGAENIYIDARQFNQTLRQAGVTDEQLAQVLPDVAPTLAQAVQSGDDIVIPTADYAARIAGTDLGNALMQHARIDPDAMSAAEAVQFQVNKDRILADAERVLQEKMTTDEAFVQSAKTVETRFLEQLKATGRYTDKVNRDNAAFVRDFVVTQAAQLNMMPEAFYDRYMYRVQASDQPRTAQMFGQEEMAARLPAIEPGQQVDGLTVREDVPNMASISASLNNYTVLPGVRSVPIADLGESGPATGNLDALDARTRELAEAIGQSNEINPLIVVYSGSGNYVLEGAHRIDALDALGKQSIPAIVVIDQDDPPGAGMLRQAMRVTTGRTLFEDIVQGLGLTDAEINSTALEFMTGLPGDMAFLPPSVGQLSDVVAFLHERRMQSGLPVLDITKAEDRTQLARLMAAEALAHIRNAGDSLEWYDATVAKTLAMMGLKYPELNTDPRARNAFILAMAIASQGLNPEANLAFADKQYAAFRETIDPATGIGAFPVVGQGDSAGAMANNFQKANDLIAAMGPDMFRRFLVTEFTVRELDSAGFPVGGENMDTVVTGSAVFGPKIGFGFYSNLSGNFEPTTMDMWFMRTVGRLSGTLPEFKPEKFAKQIQRMRNALRERGPKDRGLYASQFDRDLVAKARTEDESLIALAREVKRRHEKDFKQNRAAFDAGKRIKTDLVKAADTILISLEKPRDIPSSGGERNHLRDVVAQMVDLVTEQYGDRKPPAALQALIWYPEQEFYKAMGVKLSVTSQDYAGAARKILLGEGFDGTQLNDAADIGARSLRPSDGETDAAAISGDDRRADRARALEGDERARFIVERNRQILDRERAAAARVNFEVAPDPNDLELSAKWNALSQEQKLEISLRVAQKIVPKVMRQLKIKGEILSQTGSYLDDTNPSFAIRVDKGDPAGLAKVLGFVLSQDSMMAIASSEFEGSFRAPALKIDVGEKTTAEIEQIYNALRAITIEGQQPIGGQSTSGGVMTILLDSSADVEAISTLADSALNSSYRIGVAEVFASFPEKDEYDYARVQDDPAGDAGVVRQRSRDARAEATDALRSELDAIAAQPNVFRQADARGRGSDRGVGSGNIPRYGRTDIPGAISVRGVHYSYARRESLDSARYGTGARGDEARRLASPDADPRIRQRVYFYVDEGTGVIPESGVGYHAHEVDLDGLYNAKSDPLGLAKGKTFNEFEAAVLDAGFIGYAVGFGQGKAAVLLGEHNVSVAYAGMGARPPQQFAQETRGGFDPSRLTTILNEQADVSTFLHETAHFFLTVYADMATMPEATEQMRQDMQTVLDWFGVPDLATFNAMSLDEQRQYHEQFAYNFELYMFEGKAPNVKLQGMFDRFAAFLRRIYRSIRDDLNALYREENGRDLPILTGEVRGVMDRMLASEDQIKQAEAVRNMAAMFQTQEEAQMDDAAWAAYQQMMQEARDASVTDLTKASLRQMKWLQNARGRVLKELQAQAKTERDRIRVEVEKEVADEPVYRAMRWLQKGEVTDPQTGEDIKATAGFRLNKAAIAEMYPETALSRPDLTKLRGMTAADGLHPDVVAEMFGFSSGDQLVRSLIDAGPMKAAVDARTDQRMLAENSELVDPAAIELAVEQALHNEARARFVAVELRHLAKATEPVRVMIAAAKLAAQSMLAGKKVGEIRPRDHSIAEGRAAKRSVDAMKAGRSAEAQEAKQAQLIQNQLAAEATRIRQDIAKQLDYMRRVTRDSNRKRMGADAADQIDALLARFELRPVTLREAAQRADLAQWIESQRQAGYEPDIAPELVSQAMRVDYRQLTVQQFGDLVSAVEQIEALGRNEQRMITQAKEIAYAQARDEIVLSINENARGRTVQARTARTNAGRAAQKIKGFFSEHLKAAAIARILDGGKDGGPMWTYLISTANERGNNEVKMRAQATQDLTRIMAPLLKNPGMSGNGMVYPSVGRNLNGENRLVIALNWGNESNRQRLMGGEGWQPDQITAILQTMTAEELRAVQAIWDYFETYRPLIAAKERRVYGKEPRWIDPAPFTIMSADGQTVEMRGGYYPVKYDPMASERAEAFAEAEEAQRMLRGAYTTATTRRSFTKARVEEVVGRPLLYTLDGLYNGLNDVIHDLNWHEWLIDANKLLRSASIDAAIREQYGPEFKRQLKMWIEDVAVGERGANGAGEMALGWLRQSVSAAGLGFNVMSALQQVTGFSSSIVRIGYAAVGRGILKTIGSPAATFRMVNEKSSFMQERGRTQFRELNELRNVIRGQSRAARMVQLGAYVMMMRMQRMVDVPTWVGAYEQAVANGAADVLADGTIDDSRAVALADQAVIDSQGSGMVKDLSKIERGGQAMKLFTVFYSYMNTQFNLLVTSTMTARSRGRLASDYLMLLVAPVVLSLAIKDAAVPSGDDDEDDFEKLARTLAAEELSYMMGMMVVLREFAFAGKVLTGAEGGGRGYSGPAGLRAISDIGTLAIQAGQGEFDTAFRKAAINVLGDFTGLPSAQINRTINGIDALIEGETQNPAAVVLGYQP
jgi:hypothetical protein